MIPAALENQITSANVDQISEIKVLIEAANGPTTRMLMSLLKTSIFLIQDFLANAGGELQLFEQVQCNTNYFWEKDDVDG